MIWDGISKFGNDHPVVMRGIVGTIVMVLFGYLVLAALTSEIIDGNRDSCERGNATRLITFNLAVAAKEKDAGLEALALNEGNDAEARIWREEKKAQQEAVEGYIRLAKLSGNQIAEGSVTINCVTEWPKPLPWLGD